MSDWRTFTIGQLCDDGLLQLQTGPFGTQLHAHDYVPEGVPVVPTEALHNRRIEPSVLPKITLHKAKELDRHRLNPGDILFARRGVQATGHIGYVRAREKDYICGTGAIRLRVTGQESVLPEFLSHLLANPASVAWFKFHAIGATMPNLNEGIIRSFPLRLPPLQEQKTIADLLTALDDTIDVNRDMNNTLETTIRTIFQEWFPTVVNPGGGTADNRFSQIASVSRDSISPSHYHSEVFDHYSIPAYDERCLPSSEEGREIKSNKFLVHAGSVLLSKLNPRIPRVWLPTVSESRKSLCSTEFLVLLPRRGWSPEFVYGLCTSRAFQSVFSGMVTGTSGSHQRVKSDDLENLPVEIPPSQLVEEFTHLAVPIHAQLALNLKENATLGSLRDTLLPKLVSGEVRITQDSHTTEATL